MLGDSIRRNRSRGRKSPRGGRRSEPALRWRHWLTAALIVLPLAFGAGYAVAAIILFPGAPREEHDLVQVPMLNGTSRAEAERELQALGLTVEEVTELPHPTAPAGTVIAQSPLPGQLLHTGAAVRFAISTGRPLLAVPDLIGLPYSNAASIAENLGFTVNRLEELSDTATDLVLRIEPAPGTPRELPATVTLIVASPPDTAEQERLIPDLPGLED